MYDFLAALLVVVSFDAPDPLSIRANLVNNFVNNYQCRKALYNYALKKGLIDSRETYFQYIRDCVPSTAQDPTKVADYPETDGTDTYSHEYEYYDPGWFLREIRSRYAALKGAPSVDDCLRFPPNWSVVETRAFSREYIKRLEARKPILYVFQQEAVDTIIDYCNKADQVWQYMDIATSQVVFSHRRREALLWLQEKLGDDYYKGKVPPAVPLTVFQSID